MQKRYLLPLPCALVLSFVIWEVRFAISGSVETALRLLLPTALLGLASFPVGLAVPWISQGLLTTAWPFVSFAGYGLYIGLSWLAWKRGSTRIGLVLVLLLLYNMTSCQVQDSAIQKAIGLE
jgi:hypothetical protein